MNTGSLRNTVYAEGGEVTDGGLTEEATGEKRSR